MYFNIQYTDHFLQSNTGLALISKLLDRIPIQTILKRYGLSTRPAVGQYSDQDILLSKLGLICIGTPHFEAIDLVKSDRLFRSVFRISNLPSKETLRQRANKMAFKNEFALSALQQINFCLLKKYATPQPIKHTQLIPVDFDVTVLDNTGSKKEGVAQSYRPKIKGYAPMMTNIGNQGYLLNHQFRKGNAHSNCPGTLAYIEHCMQLARSICPNQKLLARFDSGNDADQNIVLLTQLQNTYFIVKHHLKGRNVANSKQTLIQYVMDNYSAKVKLPNNTIRYFAEQPYLAGIYDDKGQFIQKSCRRILSVVELNNDMNNGQPLLIPYRSLHMWRTNLPKSKYAPKTIVDLYKDHGTSEQFHSEFKSELDIERMPSSKFKTNQLIFAIAQIAFNLLRIIGQLALHESILNPKKQYSRLRIRTVLLKIIFLPSRLMKKNKVWTICLPRSNPLSKLFHQIYDRI